MFYADYDRTVKNKMFDPNIVKIKALFRMLQLF